MSRRVKLPGASELFRPTGSEDAASPAERPVEVVRAVEAVPAVPETAPVTPVRPVGPAETAPVVGTGRVRHEEKITVYVSREELLALEQARLRLRAELGLAVDRGRLVRAAVALALADLDDAGTDGEIVRRLTAS